MGSKIAIAPYLASAMAHRTFVVTAELHLRWVAKLTQAVLALRLGGARYKLKLTFLARHRTK
jgi:hypothetical protein